MPHSSNTPPEQYVSAIARAELPAVVHPLDLLRHFPTLGNLELATKAICLGCFGPWCLLHGKPVLLREDLQGHLRLRMAERLNEHKELVPCGRQPEVQG